MKTTLLVDGDGLRYIYAFRNEETYDFGGVSAQRVDTRRALQEVEEDLSALKDQLYADHIVVCLSDSTNWRHAVLPSYKANRDESERPELHGPIGEFLEENYETYTRPSLEADDVLGILSTSSKIIPGRKIIVSPDKDMKTIPGWYYNPRHPDPPIEITKEEADFFHLMQAFAGDPVDGYFGCPNIGMKKAEQILKDPFLLEPEEYEVTRGKNKGEVRTKWHKVPTDDLWACIVSHYERWGLTAEDALQQARVARICRNTDYNFKTREVNLWNPNMTQ